MEKIAAFSERLRAVMMEKGLTAAELSRLSRIDRSLLSKYLHGIKNPKIENIRKLAAVLYVSPEWLEGYDVEKAPAALELSPLEVDLVLGFRDLDGNDKYFLLEYIKKRQG